MRNVLDQGGVYRIVNRRTGDQYVGSAVNLRRRWRSHVAALNGGYHKGVILARAWQKYGAESFEFSPLLVCDREHLLMYEQRALDVLEPAYNICPAAGTRRGSRLTPEQRERLSKLRKAQPRSEAQLAHLQTLAVSAKGRKTIVSEEQKRQISATLKGRKLSAEHRAAIGAGVRGMSRSPETRARMSEAAFRRWARQRGEV